MSSVNLELLEAGRGARAVVVVPGFLTEKNDLTPWVANLRAGRFAGDIWGVRWESGSFREMLGAGGAAGVAAAALAKFATMGAGAVPVAIIAGAVGGWKYWRAKIDLARSSAPDVRRQLLRWRNRYRYSDVSLIAHSLGVELTWTMLEGARTVPADRFVLLGGASSATDGCWDGLEIDADVYNVGHRNDRVLRFFYELAERDLPLGLADAGGQLINVDVGGMRLPTFGHGYGPVFASLEAPHRWRPRHFRK